MLSGSQVIAFVLFDLAVILVAARACGAAARRVGQPAVVGEIIAGVLLGPTLLGPALAGLDNPPGFLDCEAALALVEVAPSVTSCLFPPQAQGVLNGFGQLALLLFMFLAGLELDFSQLAGKYVQIVTVAVAVVAVPVVVAFGINPILYTDVFIGQDSVSSVAFALFVAALISITALPIMVRILQEKGIATSDLGAVGIAAAAVVTVLMFLLVSLASGVAAGRSTAALVGNVGLAGVYLAVMVFLVRPVLARRLGGPYMDRVDELGLLTPTDGPVRDRDDDAWSQMDEFAPAGAGTAMSHAMFAWILVLVLLSGWVAHLLGINVIVGGFVAGVILPVRKGLVRDMTTELFDFTVVILLPVFLAFAGLNTDFSALTVGALPGLVVFLVACVAAKWGAGALVGRTVGLSAGESNLLGILMNCRGLLPLVVALIGVQQQVISPALQVGAVIMALVTTAMTGPLFDRFNSAEPVTTA
ncbi:cation:proton antiporter [Euzebya tangerina]|uniref:cation:proton antiporter n=1 Tax=Euzebya tangerina TaxID=591198 RepID=UPI0013C31542|nr:cation:proton antiporter [Euzebya tangerina]